MSKELTFAEVSRSLNRLEGFVDDLLLTAQTLCNGSIDIGKFITNSIQEIKWNREGDESINYLGVHDCVDFVLNHQSMQLAKRAFSIESKVADIEQIILSYLSEIRTASDFLWETGRIIGEIQELHVEPFVKELPLSEIYPEIPTELENLFPNKSQCIDFVRRNYTRPANFVANAYMEEQGVIDPSDTNRSIPVVPTLFRYFVEPFVEKEKKESARTGFYRLFK